MPTCFWRRSCVSRMCDKSAESMGISCTGPLAFFQSSSCLYGISTTIEHPKDNSILTKDLVVDRIGKCF